MLHTATSVLLINNMRQLGVGEHVNCEKAEFLKCITSCLGLWMFGVFFLCFSVLVAGSVRQNN